MVSLSNILILCVFEMMPSVTFSLGQTSPVQTPTLTLSVLSITYGSSQKTCVFPKEALSRISLSTVSLDSLTRVVTFYLHT